MSVLPNRSSVEGMTKEEATTACHTTLVHVFTRILIANNLLEERRDGLFAFTESAAVDEGDEVEEIMPDSPDDVTEETPLTMQDVFQVPRLRVVEEESDPDSSSVASYPEETIQPNPIPVVETRVDTRRTGVNLTRQDHELIQQSLNLDPRFLIIMDAENIAMKHGRHCFFSVRGIEIVRDYFERRGHKVIGFIPEYCLDERNWKERWDQVQKKLENEEILEDDPSSRTPDDMPGLRKLMREGVLSLSPCKDYSDSYAIEYAKRMNGIIITNDRFKDAVKKIKRNDVKRITEIWFRAHCITYAFVGDDFIPNPDYEPPEYFDPNEE